MDSEVGAGTTFTVLLPSSTEAEVPELQPSLEIQAGAERLLCVDDEPGLVELEREALQSLGYQVTATASSVEALQLIARSPDSFDLVITDQTMPHIRGDQLAQRLLKIRPELPIILLSGHSDLIDEVRSEELGIRRFVHKPIDFRQLARVVRETLDDTDQASSEVPTNRPE